MNPDPDSAPIGVVLAAGEGTRLRPMTLERPKALCPVNNSPLADIALARMEALGDRLGHLVVNAHHLGDQIVAHVASRGGHPIESSGEVDGRLWSSFEPDRPLGTAGALARIAEWFPGRDMVVVNGDAWTNASLEPLLAEPRGARVLLSASGAATLGPGAAVAGALVPAGDVAGLSAEPSGLFSTCWEPRLAEGTLEVVTTREVLIDCGDPASYLLANMAASGGRSVIGEGADVAGTVERSVVWPGAVVATPERLIDAIRTTGGRTVLVR